MDIAFVGCGEHAGVVLETAHALGHRLRAVVDSQFRTTHWRDAEVFDTNHIPQRDDWSWILAFGSVRAPADRFKALQPFPAQTRWATLIHPSAYVSPSAVVEHGVFIGPRAVINTGAVIRAHAIINTGAVIEHDCVIGAGSHVSPGAVIGGSTTVGERTHIGLGALLRDHVTIGDLVTIGMGAVVIAPVANGQTVIGVPAREHK